MIVAGFGFRKDATLASFQSALQSAGAGHIDALATLNHKAGQLAPLAELLSLPLIPLDPAQLVKQETLTNSRASLAAYGTGSVAEAAALAAAGEGARLLAPRSHAADRLATCALAEGKAA